MKIADTESNSAAQVLLDAITSYCASFDPPRSPDLYMAGLLHLLMLSNPNTNSARDQLAAVVRHMEELLHIAEMQRRLDAHAQD